MESDPGVGIFYIFLFLAIGYVSGLLSFNGILVFLAMYAVLAYAYYKYSPGGNTNDNFLYRANCAQYPSGCYDIGAHPLPSVAGLYPTVTDSSTAGMYPSLILPPDCPQ